MAMHNRSSRGRCSCPLHCAWRWPSHATEERRFGHQARGGRRPQGGAPVLEASAPSMGTSGEPSPVWYSETASRIQSDMVRHSRLKMY